MLEQTVHRRHNLAPEEQFERWRDLVRRAHAPMEVTACQPGVFEASHRLIPLGGVTVWPAAFQPARIRRTPRLIRLSDPEAVHLALPLTGPVDITHAGTGLTCPPGSLYVLSTSRPFEVRPVRAGVTHSGISLEIPRDRLPLSVEGVTRLAARPLPAGDGYGAILARMLHQVVREADGYRSPDGPRLSTIITEVVSALLTASLEDGPAAGAGPDVLLLQAKAFIRDNLHDPELTPTAVAAAHHISRSYLHRLFHRDGTSVAAWIRSRRLEHARRDLAHHSAAALPIRAVAVRWGFRHQADFSRAFRAAYGCAPRDYRQQHLRPGGSGPAGRD
ncbi:helix-turn-helix domain-containing protein [Kitasatospora sp. NPDC051853]|uniref:helix-turn-helix domain-containing protein n=1 Tax=Kitasatospora sp. NPDC051853 TaxID=3364058 RepID=UPI00378C62E7